MPLFDYTARTQANEVIKGSMTALTPGDARSRLKSAGYLVTSVKERDAAVLKGAALKRIRIKNKDIIDFCENLAAMLDAGINIMESMNVIAKQAVNPDLKEIIKQVRKEIESGSTLGDSLEKFPNVFSPMVINLARAGEEGGFLVAALKRIAIYVEREEEIKHRVISALVYPGIVLSLAGIIVTFLLAFVIPVFAKTYADLRGELPLPTRILVEASNYLRSYWLLIAVFFVTIFASYKYFKRTEFFAVLVDNLKLKIPLIGALNKKVLIASFTRTLGSLLSSGIGMVYALQITKKVVQNKAVQKVIEGIIADVKGGKHLEDIVTATGMFPPMVIQMVSVGNQTGRLDAMLARSADYLDKEIEITVRRLLSILDPVMTIFIAVIIGFMTISIYLPMFNITSMVR